MQRLVTDFCDTKVGKPGWSVAAADSEKIKDDNAYLDQSPSRTPPPNPHPFLSQVYSQFITTQTEMAHVRVQNNTFKAEIISVVSG